MTREEQKLIDDINLQFPGLSDEELRQAQQLIKRWEDDRKAREFQKQLTRFNRQERVKRFIRWGLLGLVFAMLGAIFTLQFFLQRYDSSAGTQYLIFGSRAGILVLGLAIFEDTALAMLAVFGCYELLRPGEAPKQGEKR